MFSMAEFNREKHSLVKGLPPLALLLSSLVLPMSLLPWPVFPCCSGFMVVDPFLLKSNVFRRCSAQYLPRCRDFYAFVLLLRQSATMERLVGISVQACKEMEGQ